MAKWVVITCTGDGELRQQSFDSEELAKEAQSLALTGMGVKAAEAARQRFWDSEAARHGGLSAPYRSALIYLTEVKDGDNLSP